MKMLINMNAVSSHSKAAFLNRLHECGCSPKLYLRGLHSLGNELLGRLNPDPSCIEIKQVTLSGNLKLSAE